jgi:hypothetical protein
MWGPFKLKFYTDNKKRVDRAAARNVGAEAAAEN